MPPPRFQISSHVLGFTIACIPCIAYAYYADKNAKYRSNEEYEKMLRENYSDNIQKSKNQRGEMIHFFEGIKNPGSNPETERKIQEVLRGGRDESKRHYAVDKKLFGTEEGVRLRHEAEEEAAAKKKKREARIKKKKSMEAHKSKKKNNKKGKDAGTTDVVGSQTSQVLDESDKNGTKDPINSKEKETNVIAVVDQKSALTLVAVGALAATASILLGGKRQ